MKNNAIDNEISFEEAYKRLEEISSLLDSGETELEKSFVLYEEGQKLMTICQKMLDNAEKKLKIISSEKNEFRIEERDIEQS